MGGEIAQNDEWRYNASVDWHLLEYPEHAGVQRLVAKLNAVYRDQPALWEQDFDWPGFRSIDPNDADQSVLSFVRFPVTDQRVVACIANGWNDLQYSASMTLPPLGVVWLAHEG